MKLYPLLNDRNSVNVLKILYDNETKNKNSYTLKLSEVKKAIGLSSYPKESALLLSTYGLIALDYVDNDYIVSITNKGKEFIEIFDQLVDIFKPKTVGEKSVSIRYELTGQEKRILVMAYKISKETGRDFIPLNLIVQEIYPYNQQGKASTVSRYISKLEEIKLMEKKKEGRNILVSVTEQGFKTIREQYLKGLMQ
ncbi:MAG: hypothetical protein NT001_05785 [Candidatus Woesearchaeota archaeon]|nr:hypothetical protein [Candidatus Woesearchaeota archaeon]